MKKYLLYLLILFCSSYYSYADISQFNVLDCGAVGDGKTDNTTAFQSALNKAAPMGGIVYVPAGQYKIAGVLTIPDGVTLKGIAEGPVRADFNRGTMLLAYSGRDNEDSQAFITLMNNSTIKGLSIYYPEQVITDIHPYPYTIQIKGNRSSIIDLDMVNVYNGIDCGSVYHGQDYLRNIYMCAMRRGIYIDRIVDIGRVENVHIHPSSWSQTGIQESLIHDFQVNNLEGFIIGRCDWEYMVNCFVIWAKVGFRFIETKGDPIGNDPQANILITQSGSDVGPLAVVVEKTQYHCGIAFENCQFMDGFLIEEENRGPIKLTNCGFWGWAESLGGTHIINKGKGTVYLTACNFNAKNWIECHWKPEIPFIKMENGTLQIMNSRFQDNGNTPDAHIYLGEKVRSAVIIGNSVEGGDLHITNKSEGDVQILGNVRE